MPIRLTLRTLLAYLDDALEPSSALEIGQKLSEHAHARELEERIRTVIRRRRLSAPSADPDIADVDANDVAEYLDNVLSAEGVARLERLCLDSDVSLAEVACSHQILSLVLGKPVEVRSEARERLYVLGGASGSARRHVSKVVGAKPIEAALFESRIEIPSIGSAGANRFLADARRRLAKSAVSVALAVALLVALYLTIAPASVKENTPPTSVASLNRGEDAPEALKADPAVDKAAPPNGTKTPDVAPAEKSEKSEKSENAEKSEKVEPKALKQSPPAEPSPALSKSAPLVVVGDKNKPASSADDTASIKRPAPSSAPSPAPSDRSAPRAPAPEGVNVASIKPGSTPADAKTSPAKESAPSAIEPSIPIATYGSPSGVLLRRDAQKLSRLRPKAMVYAGETLFNVDGLRSLLQLPNNARIELVDQTRLVPRVASGVDVAFDLLDGRVVVEAPGKPLSLKIGNGEREILVRLSGSHPQIAVEKTWDQSITSDQRDKVPAALLGVLVTRGDVEATAGQQTEKLTGGYEVTLQPDGSLKRTTPNKSSIAWINREPTANDLKAAQQFGQRLPSSDRVELSLREALSDRSRDVKRLAVRALAAIDSEEAVDAMGSSSPDVRLSAIAACRHQLQRDPKFWPVFRRSVASEFGENSVDQILSLTLGYSLTAYGKAETFRELIDALESDQLVVRELAITNLREATGQDRQYGADAPIMRRNNAVAQWRRWLDEQDESTLPPKHLRSAPRPQDASSLDRRSTRGVGQWGKGSRRSTPVETRPRPTAHSTARRPPTS